MSKYLATINVPGYLPMDDEPPVFDTAGEAWEYLVDERMRAEEWTTADIDAGREYSTTLDELLANVSHCAGMHSVDCPHLSNDGQGVVYGPTPGYDGSHDLGLAYSVTAVSDDEAGE